MSVKIKGLNEAITALKKLDPKLSDLGERVSQSVISSIKDRVREKGLGINGVMKYKKGRYKGFRQAKGYATNFKNLTITGNMLNSITSKKLSDLRYSIGVSRGEEAKAEGNQEREPWFGVTQSENKAIAETVQDYLKKLGL